VNLFIGKEIGENDPRIVHRRHLQTNKEIKVIFKYKSAFIK